MENVISAIKSAKGKILILTHHNADIDAISSAISLKIGLEQIGKKIAIGVSESISRPAKKLCEDFDILIDPDCKKFDFVILVDSSVPEQLKVKNLRADIIIDHHIPGKLVEKARASFIKPEAKSTAQLIYKILEKMNCKINKKIAILLAAGIVADTAHLRLADVDCLEVLLELMKIGIKMQDILNLITTPSDISESIACLKAASRAELYRAGDLILAVSEISSHEASACRALVRAGADIAIVCAIKNQEVRISSRARQKILEYNIDLSKIFKEVGKIIGGSGGGHNLAGSANGTDKKAVGKAIKFAMAEISKKIGKPWKRL